MIGSKVILTYKRKRFSLRPGLGFENECPDQSSRCQTLEASKTSVTEETDSKHESERKDPEILNQCVVNNGGSSLVQCECCHCFFDVRGLLPSDEHLEVKKLCSSCVKRENHLSSCEDTAKEKKTGFPLITFSRRSKHKKTVEKYGLVAAKGSNSSQEKKTSEDIEFVSVPKIEISETLSGEEASITEKCISLNDIPAITQQASGTSPMNAISHDASLKDKQPEASECHVSAVDDELQIVSSDGLESAKSTPDKIRDGGSLASFDLSKPPPESSGLVDCNLTLESSSNIQPDNNISETHRDSTDSTSRSHSSTVLHDLPSQGNNRVLELLDDRIGEASLSQAHRVHARPSNSSTHLLGVDLPSVSISQSQTSKNNFLQLFPEDIMNNTLPSNTNHLHFRSSRSSTSSFNLSSLLPTEPNKIYFNTKTHDSITSQYPSDSVSLLRHKMMLDSIISKARAVSGSRTSNIFLDNFDPPMFSEEELDCLWIGVRRHGVGNWDAMLRDHRLQFATWRAPHELAQRWEQEQSKLLTTNSPCRKKRFRPMVVKKLEEQLSLGSSNFQNGPRAKSTLVNVNHGNLPHWLQEAVNIPNPVSACVSYTGHSGMMQWINQPFSGSNRTAGIAPSVATRCPNPPELMGRHQGCPISKQDDVIVINSDASSEETISDDHSVRH